MIVFKTAFAIRLMDDFTGKRIEKEKFIFRIHGKVYQPIVKEEGIYIFLEPMEKSVILEISGPAYHSARALVEKELLDPKEPLAEIRMHSRPGKKIGMFQEYITGMLTDKKLAYPVEICVKSTKETGLTLKEQRQTNQTRSIVVNGFTKENLIGKTFALSTKKEIDIFVITDKISMNEYRIAGEIKSGYKPQTPIERVYRSVTAPDGSYAIPIEAGNVFTNTEVITLQHKNHYNKEGGL